MSLHRWTIIDEATGRILRFGAASNPRAFPKLNPGERRVDDVHLDTNTQWVDGDEVRERPTLDLPDAIERGLGVIDVSGLPKGTQVYRRQTLLGESDGGMFRVAADVPTRMALHLAPPFPYREHHMTIVADRAGLEARARQKDEARRQRLAGPLEGLRPPRELARE